ncbi:MAG TPA: hypothetical protein VKW76_12050 [Candidatus Binatia bacterium]|nr:hypothetical protein [Candidatus Binatia bacterium]
MRRLPCCLATLLLAVPFAAAQPIPRTVDGYAVLADHLLRTKGPLTVDGAPIGVNAGSLLTHGPLAAGHLDVITNAGPGNAVRLRPGSQCARLFTDPARVTGVNCSSSPVAAFTGPILEEPLAAACGFPSPPPPCFGSGVTVGHGGVVHLAGGTPGAPRAYGTALVLGAPTPGTLVLDGGSYVFCGLRIASRAQLLVGSAAQVFVSGDLELNQDTIVGPDPASPHPPAPGDIRFLVAGGRAHLSRRTRLTGHVCAPNGVLSMAAGAEAFGGLAALVVSTDRAVVHGIPGPPPTTTTTTSTSSTTVTTTTATSSSTTSTSITVTTTTTTSTTLPSCVCGDGIVDSATGCFEQCDLGSPGEGILGVPCPGGEACVDCRCVPSTTTTTTTPSTSTTSTTLPCRCGDGIVNASPGCGEQCDSASGSVVDQCPSGARCNASCTCEPTEPVIPPPPRCETCADFQNPACCLQQVSMTIRRGAMGRRGKGTRLDLHSLLVQSGFRPTPHHDDVLIQLRRGDAELLCAEVPAAKLMKMHRGRVIGFWDYKHHVASAKHVDDVAFRLRKAGGVKLHVFGRKVEFATPSGGDLTVAVVLRDPSAPSTSQCSTVTQSFRTTRTQGLRAP